ncbi:MAG TPA: hypothetical protein VD926_15665 [Acidimicrobiales bacterium]|nr:hypothetical protein [Acidimicrobiales bacterium]
MDRTVVLIPVLLPPEVVERLQRIASGKGMTLGDYCAKRLGNAGTVDLFLEYRTARRLIHSALGGEG